MKDVPKSMRRTGMLLFRDALMEALQGQQPLCVVHAAHAAEILLKARIAQEHPLLIFSRLPKADSQKETLTLMDLLENGHTLSYGELPDRLWATTGIKIKEKSRYEEFGKLRNQIIHFSMSSIRALDVVTVQYALEVLDPLVENFWGKSVIDFITKDPDHYYANFISSGFFEDSIKKAVPINQRLRKLLGNASKKAWENMHESSGAGDGNESPEYWESSYEMWLESHDPEMEEYHEQFGNEKMAWQKFLESF